MLPFRGKLALLTYVGLVFASCVVLHNRGMFCICWVWESQMRMERYASHLLDLGEPNANGKVWDLTQVVGSGTLLRNH